ncbi:MAG TPA: hypothetical protein PKE26_00430 [Kiritimatiellia bacterium]|nr:hypothetical protein [Kiritimatiellia bacterium]HMO97559.1 hypothetical protein [Kiritimatiellia bacterium]HMP95955.1 hypothetical protein [Kiritimatiellia bacterium]
MNTTIVSYERKEIEATLHELSRLSQKFPSRQLYEQMAACYRQMNEMEEAEIMMDLASRAPARETAHGLLTEQA